MDVNNNFVNICQQPMPSMPENNQAAINSAESSGNVTPKSSQEQINIFTSSYEDIERALKAFDFKGFTNNSSDIYNDSLNKALEAEKRAIQQEQEETIEKYQSNLSEKANKEINFFEAAMNSIVKLTGKSLDLIL